MNIPTPHTRHPLTRLMSPNPKGADELKAMRAAAWHKLGMVVIPLDALTDDWDRQFLTSLASRLYGARTPRSRRGLPWREGETVERFDGEHWTVLCADHKHAVLRRESDGALETLTQPTQVMP